MTHQPELFTLLTGAEVFAPEPLGKTDVLLSGERIVAVAPRLEPPSGVVGTTVVDLTGTLLVPGFIDPHCHPTGAGGVSGPETRSPELPLSSMTLAGVTTIVGVLGGDGLTRSPLELLARVRGLRANGLSAYMLVGAYQVPPPTVTGDMRTDVYVIPECLGAGEIAISDSRGSLPTLEELARIVADAYMGGRLAGKRGVTNIHVGPGREGLGLLRRLASETDTPIDILLPTHLNRTESLVEQAVAWGRAGGWVDLTASLEEHLDTPVTVSTALRVLREGGVALEQITLSSDAGGVFPVTGPDGGRVLHRWESASLLRSLGNLVRHDGMALDDALRLLTTNPARAYGLTRKGAIRDGFDADLVAFAADLTSPRHVWGRGSRLVEDGVATRRDAFEAGPRATEPLGR